MSFFPILLSFFVFCLWFLAGDGSGVSVKLVLVIFCPFAVLDNFICEAYASLREEQGDSMHYCGRLRLLSFFAVFVSVGDGSSKTILLVVSL